MAFLDFFIIIILFSLKQISVETSSFSPSSPAENRAVQRSVCAVGYIRVTKPWAAVGSGVLSGH